MECEDDSNKRPLKEACYSLLTIAIGFLSCTVIVVLAYFTYRAAAGNTSYCTLWTDIPGRLAIFITFYYAAGICGCLPIPERFRINCLPQPFILYKFESWRSLFRNLCLLLPFTSINGAMNDPEMSPLRTEYDKNSRKDCSPNSGEKSKDIPIANTDPQKGRHVRSKRVAKNRDAEIANCSKESSMHFDSPIAGHIVPMAKGRSSKARYFPDSSISTTESSGKSVNDPSETLYEFSATLNERTNVVADIQEETDSPPRTPDVELLLPDYPRFPWSFLKYRGGIPQEAKALHKRHLMAERRELDKYNKKRRIAESVHLPKDSENEPSCDGFNPVAHRPPRIPQIPPRSKVGFRDRTKTIPTNLRKLGESKNRKRTVSISVQHHTLSNTSTNVIPESGDNPDEIDKKDEKNKCCDHSPDLQSKVDRIKKSLMRLGPSFPAIGEASTSRQNVDVSPRKSAEETDSDHESDGILTTSAETKSSRKPED